MRQELTAAAPFPHPSRRVVVIGLVAILACAAAARLVPVLRGGGFHGSLGYDDGVYYGAAVALSHGVLPYRDFLFLHPPGIVLLLAPFAALGSLTTEGTGFAIARLAFEATGLLSVLLVAAIARRRGPWAALLAGAVYAVWMAVAGFELTTRLTAPQNALILGAMLSLPLLSEDSVVSRRRAILAGAFLGLATLIQLWNAVPLMVLLAWVVKRSWPTPDRFLVPLAMAAAAGTVLLVVGLPFLVASDGAMLRMVVLDQISRPNAHVPVMDRLTLLAGLPRPGILARPVLEILAIGWLVVVVALVAWAVRRSPALRPVAVLFAVKALFVLAGGVFFTHYVAWPGPAGAVVIGASLADAGEWIGARLGDRRRARIAIAPVLLGVLLVSVVVNFGRSGNRLDGTALARDVASARCVAADFPVLLIATDTLHRNIANRCALVLDPTGVSYDVARGHLPPGGVVASRRRAPAYQAAMLEYYAAGSAALFLRLRSDGFTNATWDAIRARFPITVRRGSVTVLLGSGP